MAWWMAIPAVAGAAASYLGSQGEAQRAKDLQNQALAQYAGLEIPDIEKMMLNLENYTSAGQIDPYLEQAIGLGPSAYNNMMLDPSGRNAQMEALNAYTELAQTGMTDADRAAFELARQDSAAQNTAMNNAVLQSAQQRGVAGSGMEMLSKLMNNQNSAQQLQRAQLEQAQAAQQARLQALQNQANLGSSVRSQDYGQASDLARANDAVSQFNAQNQQNVQARNVASRNQAQNTNLQNQQNLLNQNVALRNQQQQYNKGLNQQQFQNQLNLAQAKSGALTGAANQATQNAANTAGSMAGIGQGLTTMLGSMNK